MFSSSDLAELIATDRVSLDYAMNLLDSSAFAVNGGSNATTAEKIEPEHRKNSTSPSKMPSPLSLTRLIVGGYVPLDYAMNLLDSSAFTGLGCGDSSGDSKICDESHYNSWQQSQMRASRGPGQLLTHDQAPLDYAMELLDTSPFTADGNRILIDTPPATPIDDDKKDGSASLTSAFASGSPANTLVLPVPTLKLDFRMSVQLNPKISVGEGPWGQRNWISFTGGNWAGTWAKGTVVVSASLSAEVMVSTHFLQPGGQDSQLVNPETLYTNVDTNYLLQTSDQPPAYITVQTSGWRTGPRNVLEKLFDPVEADSVKADEYSFRVVIKLESGDQRYKEQLNSGIWVGSGARRGSEGTKLHLRIAVQSLADRSQSSTTHIGWFDNLCEGL